MDQLYIVAMEQKVQRHVFYNSFSSFQLVIFCTIYEKEGWLYIPLVFLDL